MSKLAHTLAERQHPVVIVDAPLLTASRVHSFWATAKVRATARAAQACEVAHSARQSGAKAAPCLTFEYYRRFIYQCAR